jgi:hypothetical protein
LVLVSRPVRETEPTAQASDQLAATSRQRLLFWRKPAPAPMPATWLPSHRGLLVPVDPNDEDLRAPQAPDLVVVSTAYSHVTPRRGLILAAELARDCDVALLVLCSKEACSRASLEALEKLLRDLGVLQAHVVRLTAQSSALTTFEVDRLWVSRAWRRGGARPGERRITPANDVGRKRNVALAAAVAVCAGSVLFLDDDIFLGDDAPGGTTRHPRTLDRARLAAAVRATTSGQLRAVGWPAVEFDDNSVLFRIRAQMGSLQSQFIGGGVLLVSTSEPPPFFPSIFNEDWLFLLSCLQRSGSPRVLGEAGDVHQEWREPYSPRRAKSEELGDLLGEGLFTRVRREGIDLAVCETTDYWIKAFHERRSLREQLQQQVAESSHDDRAEMLDALAAVAEVHLAIEKDGFTHLRQLADYMRTWRQDLERWDRDLALPGRLRHALAAETTALLTIGEAPELSPCA